MVRSMSARDLDVIKAELKVLKLDYKSNPFPRKILKGIISVGSVSAFYIAGRILFGDYMNNPEMHTFDSVSALTGMFLAVSGLASWSSLCKDDEAKAEISRYERRLENLTMGDNDIQIYYMVERKRPNIFYTSDSLSG